MFALYIIDNQDDLLDGANFRQVLDEDFPDVEPPISPKVCPTVTCPDGGKIYKSTLVGLLNNDPRLPTDRSVTQILSYRTHYR